jgi:hypothetical protein
LMMVDCDKPLKRFAIHPWHSFPQPKRLGRMKGVEL